MACAVQAAPPCRLILSRMFGTAHTFPIYRYIVSFIGPENRTRSLAQEFQRKTVSPIKRVNHGADVNDNQLNKAIPPFDPFEGFRKVLRSGTRQAAVRENDSALRDKPVRIDIADRHFTMKKDT